MPPKKDPKLLKPSAEVDLSDISTLPPINDFVFTTLYAFKHRRSQVKMEEALRMDLDLSLQQPSQEPELIEAQKRNKVIVLKDLLENAETKGYLTAAEIAENKDLHRMQQALARSTNDLLVSMQLPLRREKQQQLEQFTQALSAVTDPEERKQLSQAQQEKLKMQDLTVWLKDFPRSAADFKEMRRSAAQHMPEVDIAIHAAILVEEKFKHNYDDDGPAQNVKLSEQQQQEADELQARLLVEEYPHAERQNVYKDLLYIHRYAQNCPVNSQMKLLVPERIIYKGPDPPPQDWAPADLEPPTEQQQQKTAPKGKQVDVIAAPEVIKSPAVEQADKTLRRFMKSFMTVLGNLQTDLNEYRQLTKDIPKVALWPKVLSEQEKQAIKDKEEAQRKAQEEAEAQAAAEVAAAFAAANKGKPAPAAKVTPSRPLSGAGKDTTSRPTTPLSTRQKIAEAALVSLDDGQKDWHFEHYSRVVAEMQAANSNVGSILAAMVYQIEKQNEPLQTEQTDKKQLAGQLDALFDKIAFESAAHATDFRHTFSDSKLALSLPNPNSSPYQTIIQSDNRIAINSSSYIFLNGKEQGHYEQTQLDQVKLPTVNSKTLATQHQAAKQIAETEADMQEIVSYCKDLPENQAKRMIILKQMQDLMHSNNPERTYNFMDRIFLESYDLETFQQLLNDMLILEPDVLTCYLDPKPAAHKKDCLSLIKNNTTMIMALNFKNPPGRILRRQWTQPLVSVPDYLHYRMFKNELTFPKTQLNIPQSNLSLLRQNSKYCYPCDNSVIRINRNFVGARCFGSSRIIKDNFTFGIKELGSHVGSKVPMEDQILNFETKKTTDRRGEFWLEFENGVKMFAEMLDPAPAETSAIPPLGESRVPTKRQESKRKVVITEQRQMQPRAETAKSQQSILRSRNNSSQQSALSDQELLKVPSQIPSQVTSPTKRSSEKTDELGGYVKDKGASITLTFKEGLVVQILPNGAVQQTICSNSDFAKRATQIQTDIGDEVKEVMRTVTREGALIRFLQDGNKVIYLRDGTVTKTDIRKGIWTTTNPIGVVRERNLRTGAVCDLPQRLKVNTKVDPETAATVSTREDGLLKIDYVDGASLVIFADETRINVQKSKAENEEARVVTTFYEKEGYSTVKITFDPIKARAQTMIGLGGADALMGRDGILERSNGGLISETFLPDRSVITTYFEKQELPGVNNCSRSLIHLLRRHDYSVIKVRQDGEIVLVTANERAYLNQIGKQMEFGTKDYDYFFELFGMPLERRSGVYTCNLEQGRIWTLDEEGNFFIVYANGESVQKLSVSFNLDQMVEGIENKEPDSPRIKDGEYVEDECKFLPPPKTVGHPRLFLLKNQRATEYSNSEQLQYLLRTNQKDPEVQKTADRVSIHNESVVSHLFMQRQSKFSPSHPSTLAAFAKPVIPQVLEMINQTVAIASEPEKSRYLKKNIFEYEQPSEEHVQSLFHAIGMRDSLQQRNRKEAERLSVKRRDLTTDQVEQQTKIWLRIARQRGIAVNGLIDREYSLTKQLHRDKEREQAFGALESTDSQ